MAVQNKEAKMVNVAEAILSISGQKGIAAITHAQVARSAGVSRPWIYKYVGKTKSDLIAFSVRYLGNYFAALDDRNVVHSRKEFKAEMVRTTDRMMRKAGKHPWIIASYFRFRNGDSLFGQEMTRIEEMFLNIFTQEIRIALKVETRQARFIAETITAMRMGMAYYWLFNRGKSPKVKNEILKLVEFMVDGALKSL